MTWGICITIMVILLCLDTIVMRYCQRMEAIAKAQNRTQEIITDARLDNAKAFAAAWLDKAQALVAAKKETP